MKEFSNKIVVVTGSAKGIGKECCRMFAQNGANVIMTGRGENVRDAEKELKDEGLSVSSYLMDVSIEKDVNETMKQIVKDHGKVDVLVNNAGIYNVGNSLEMEYKTIDKMIDINVKGVVNTIRAALPSMIENKFGRIINISSICGISSVTADEAYYAMTKSSLLGLTKGIALEQGMNGITCNIICPGIIETPLLLNAAKEYAPENPEAALKEFAKVVPVGRIGKPADIANAVMFLASENNGFINGTHLIVDGGQSQQL
jgi:3-oxoacyl-[acyl-carrier protein] reductase